MKRGSFLRTAHCGLNSADKLFQRYYVSLYTCRGETQSVCHAAMDVCTCARMPGCMSEGLCEASEHSLPPANVESHLRLWDQPVFSWMLKAYLCRGAILIPAYRLFYEYSSILEDFRYFTRHMNSLQSLAPLLKTLRWYSGIRLEMVLGSSWWMARLDCICLHMVSSGCSWCDRWASRQHKKSLFVFLGRLPGLGA